VLSSFEKKFMQVNIHYHALLREKTGKREQRFELTTIAPKAADAVAAFIKAYPAFAPLESSLHVAVNNNIVSRDFPISTEDHIDLMPPFGGG
jgi:molybdopterin converting factor small subunit